MNKRYSLILVGILLVILLAACQSPGNATPAGFNGPGGRVIRTPGPDMMTEIASNPDFQTRIASGGGPAGGFGAQGGQIAQATTPTPAVEPSRTSTPEPSATATPETNAAVQTAQEYFTALENGDFAAASKLVSAFSLMAAEQTAGDVVAALIQRQSQGDSWSDLKIVDSHVFDEKTILVHVTYQLTEKNQQTGKTSETAVDEQLPFRLENKRWLYNWTNIIDFKTLGTDAKQAAGLTVKPMQLIRYSDRIRLVLLAQNNTSGAIVIGRPNQILATFHFGSQSVDAIRTRYFLDAWRSYTDVNIEVMGLFTTYPDAVEIVKYTESAAAPWFTFGLVD